MRRGRAYEEIPGDGIDQGYTWLGRQLDIPTVPYRKADRWDRKEYEYPK